MAEARNNQRRAIAASVWLMMRPNVRPADHAESPCAKLSSRLAVGWQFTPRFVHVHEKATCTVHAGLARLDWLTGEDMLTGTVFLVGRPHMQHTAPYDRIGHRTDPMLNLIHQLAAVNG